MIANLHAVVGFVLRFPRMWNINQTTTDWRPNWDRLSSGIVRCAATESCRCFFWIDGCIDALMD